MTDMANFTRKAIKETFLVLLEERPLNDITIKNIVEKCGINRNSFYYHYQDLPALIEEIIKEEAEAIIQKYPSVKTIVECYDAITESASHRKRPIMHIFSSLSRDVFERNLMTICEYFVRSYIETALAEEEIPLQDKQTVIDYYKCVCFGLTIDWLNNGMKAEQAQSIRRFFLLKKDLAIEVAQQLQGQV